MQERICTMLKLMFINIELDGPARDSQKMTINLTISINLKNTVKVVTHIHLYVILKYF